MIGYVNRREHVKCMELGYPINYLAGIYRLHGSLSLVPHSTFVLPKSFLFGNIVPSILLLLVHLQLFKVFMCRNTHIRLHSRYASNAF